MTKTILYCATVDYHFKAFHLPEMQWFKQQGWDVHVAAAGDMELPFTDKKFTIDIHRSPFHVRNIKGYKQLRTIIDHHDYDFIHAHTPLGGVLARLTARSARKKGTKVIYTAHGFHFCKGVPFRNWLLYYPIEKGLSHYTDSLLTINKEDYNLALRRGFKAKEVHRVSGVGVDTSRFKPLPKHIKATEKKSLGFDADDFLLFNASEFNRNKNQQFLLSVVALLKRDIPNIRLILAGEGTMLEDCKAHAHHLGIADRVTFLGFRKDIEDLLPVCDVAVASSFREGLPVNIMEAMAAGLPVVATTNRGHNELVRNHREGYLLGPHEPELFAEKVKHLWAHKNLREHLGQQGRRTIEEAYSIDTVMLEKQLIYQRLMGTAQPTSYQSVIGR
ncbi:putative glycosyltransferase EpsD [Lentibacillus sp. JNUCC-1]|nr:putative glycosyltransferase EpsD [Lentibacillus sp. JNUCC-1]